MFYIRSNLFSTGANTHRSFLLIIAFVVCKDALIFEPICIDANYFIETAPFIKTLNIDQYHKRQRYLRYYVYRSNKYKNEKRLISLFYGIIDGR